MTSGGRVYGGSNLPIMIQQRTHHQASTSIPSQSLEPFYLSGSSSSFLGSSSMVSFEDINGSNKNNKRSFFQSFEQDDYGDEECDEYFNQSGKKRRLSVEQLKFLEKCFEVDNKLEPDRKLQLAKDLGLQPRQVAIWFQNRRARWKTKQMEKDYDVLQESFDALKANYDSLFKEKEELKSQIELLSEEYARRQRGEEMPEAQAEPSRSQPLLAASISDSEESKVSMAASKQDYECENATSPKKDIDRDDWEGFDSDSTSTKNNKQDDMIFDSDSHYYIDGAVHSPHLEHVDSSYMFEPDHSDLSSSQDEEDSSIGFLPSTPYRVPKMEPGGDYSIASSSSSRNNFGFPAEHNAFWSWSF